MATIEDRLFSYSELYGPFPCQVNKCGADSYLILVSDEEFMALPESSRFEQSMLVFKSRGVAMCNICFDKLRKEQIIELDDIAVKDEHGS